MVWDPPCAGFTCCASNYLCMSFWNSVQAYNDLSQGAPQHPVDRLFFEVLTYRIILGIVLHAPLIWCFAGIREDSFIDFTETFL